MSDRIPYPEFDLSGKVALVTGAGRGIGRQMALDLARYGADVVLCSRTLSELEQVGSEVETLGRKALALPADVGVVAEIERMTAAAVERFGRIDILVNNAGVNVPQWAEEVTEEAWDRVMALNVKGVFFCAQTVGKVMIRQKKGKIINISSQAGSVGLIKRSAYGASKGAINQLTRVLALEWGKHHICVNALAPTFVETPMTRPMLEEKSFREYVMGNILLGRLCKPEDLTGGLIFLASDASDMVTGHILHIDGGWTAH
ncbi:MAG: glucose 1-dehydrogenase [Proteobacteria bacterium]|nr:glucose 1-dehydrogenase [Pseudomonadota bacterium]